MITDIYSIAEVTPDELRWAREPWKNFPCVRAHSNGPMELSRLGELLGVGSYEEVLAGFTFLAGESQESPWVVAIPEGLVERLTSVDGAAQQWAATRWAGAIDGHEARGLRIYLERLAEFLGDHEGPVALYIDTRR